MAFYGEGLAAEGRRHRREGGVEAVAAIEIGVNHAGRGAKMGEAPVAGAAHLQSCQPLGGFEAQGAGLGLEVVGHALQSLRRYGRNGPGFQHRPLL